MHHKKQSRKIIELYESFGVPLKLPKCEVIENGEIYIYDVKFRPGTRESKIFDHASDIQLAMKLPMFQPFREGLSLRIAVSERPVMENSLPRMLASPLLRRSNLWIPIPLGYDMRRKMHFADLAKFPHALFGGATNSGKTVGLRSLTTSLIATQPVSRLNIIIIDTGASGLDLFHSLPHLSYPIVKDTETALAVIQALVIEMEQRKVLPVDELRRLPAIVCIVDEYISLIRNVGGAGERAEVTSAISSLLQRGRHAKIHMILATQEAAKRDMLINLNNVPARMAFACSNYYNSVSILGESGAEKLPGKGAILFKSPENPTPIYLQGAFISTEEIEQILVRITSMTHDLGNKFEIHENESSQALVSEIAIFSVNPPKKDDSKKEVASIILWTLGRKTISASQIENQLHMGRRAKDIVERLFQMGIVSDKFANQPRKVLPQSVKDVPAEVMELLTMHGVAIDDIITTIQNRY